MKTVDETKSVQGLWLLQMVGMLILVVSCAGSEVVQAEWWLARSPSGKSLDIDILVIGSSCSEFQDFVIHETDDTIEVIARVREDRGGDCTGDFEVVSRSVELSEDLGARELVGCFVSGRNRLIGEIDSASVDCSDVGWGADSHT